MLHIALRLFGIEVFAFDISTEAEDDDEKLPHADVLECMTGFVAPVPEREERIGTVV